MPLPPHERLAVMLLLAVFILTGADLSPREEMVGGALRRRYIIHVGTMSRTAKSTSSNFFMAQRLLFWQKTDELAALQTTHCI